MPEDPNKAELELLKTLKEEWQRTMKKHLEKDFSKWLGSKGKARGGPVGYTERWKTGRNNRR